MGKKGKGGDPNRGEAKPVDNLAVVGAGRTMGL